MNFYICTEVSAAVAAEASRPEGLTSLVTLWVRPGVLKHLPNMNLYNCWNLSRQVPNSGKCPESVHLEYVNMSVIWLGCIKLHFMQIFLCILRSLGINLCSDVHFLHIYICRCSTTFIHSNPSWYYAAAADVIRGCVVMAVDMYSSSACRHCIAACCIPSQTKTEVWLMSFHLGRSGFLVTIVLLSHILFCLFYFRK